MINDAQIKINIKSRRENQKIPIVKFAERLGINRNTYGNIEKEGKTRMINEHLEAIAEELKTTVEELLFGYTPGDPEKDPVLQEKIREYDKQVISMAASYGRRIEEDAQRIRELTQRVKELEDALRDKTELNAFLKEKNEELEKIIRNA